MQVCEVEDCQRDPYSGRKCVTHYHRWLKSRGYKGPSRVRGTPAEQFWAKVDKRGPDECWPWTASRDAKGYGHFAVKAKWQSPHRFSYELHTGPIPEGYEVDHLCRNTSCVNPAHLEAVTSAENMARRKAATTHCKRGHEFTAENTRLHSKTRSKVCRTCMRDYGREWARVRYGYRQRRV